MSTVATISQNVMNYGFDSNTWLDRCYDWVREGIEDIVRHVDIPECFVQAPSTVTITGNSTTDAAACQTIGLGVGDVGKLVRVENVYNLTADAQLTVGDRSRVLAILANAEYASPTLYSWTSNSEEAGIGAWYALSIAPIPITSIVLSSGVFFTPQPVADSTTEESMPGFSPAEWVFAGRYERQLEAYALYRAFQTQDDAPMANYWYDEYLKGRKELAHQYTQSAKQTPRQVPGTWSYPPLT